LPEEIDDKKPSFSFRKQLENTEGKGTSFIKELPHSYAIGSN